MEEQQTIKYAPQWTNMTVDNVRPTMCADVAFDPFPLTNELDKCPLKEFLIKFSVLNGQRPLTLDFHTFCSSTGLDYNNGKYVDHPTPEVVKKELGKIAINPSYLEKTPVLKNSFLVAWRILFTFVIQVLGGNYSSTEQVNSIQQLLAYSLITETEIDIGGDHLQDSVSLPPLVAKPKRGKSQTVASTLPKSQGPEASGALSKKKKNPKSKRPPTKTKESPSIQLASTGLPSTLDESTRQSKPLPKDTATHPKDPRGNKQPLDIDMTSTTSNECTAKTTPRPEGSLRDKDSGGNIPPADMEPIHTLIADPSRTGAKYQVDETQSTRLRYRSLTKNKGKTSSEVEPDTEPLKLQTYADIQAFLLSDDELDKDSDEEEVLAAGDDMDDDPQDDKEVRTPLPKQDHPEPSHVQESASDSSSLDLKKFDNILPLTERKLIKYLRKMSRVLFNRITEKQWEQHEEATVSYVDLKASIDQYYDENIAHRDQTDKLMEASMSSLDRISTTISDLYKGLNVIAELLKDISNSVKDDPVINQKLNEATETFARISSNVTEVLSLVKGFDSFALLSDVKSLRAYAVKQEEASTARIKKDTSEIKFMMTEMYAAFQGHPSSASSGSVTPTLALTDIQANVEGENANTTATKEPPFHTEGETEEPRLTIPISLIPFIIDKGKGIATESDDDPLKKLVKASSIVRPDPDEPVREEAKKIGLDPKAIKGVKAGEMFKKAQDAEHVVLKRQHTEKVRKSLETISGRLKPKPITDIKIHPKTKPMVITVYGGTGGRNFEVYEPFIFGVFGIFKLDKLREIIPKKKNVVVKDLMNSLSRMYKRLQQIPEEHGIHPNLLALEQVSS
ncbi:hypothetical protein Tco_1265920 [Tanacetum coccineum]